MIILFSLCFIMMFLGAAHVFIEGNKDASNYVLMGIATILALAGVFFYTFSDKQISEEYSKTDYYSYMTESGMIVTLEGPFYKKDGIYYRKDAEKAQLIPFTRYDFVEVSVPQTISSSESATENEVNNFCASCGNKLNVEDNFCSGCGGKIER